MSLTPPAGALLAELRRRTGPAHVRLEDALNLLEETLNIADYRRILEKFYRFWRSWESLAASLLNEEAFFQPRRRLSLLRADLVALGLSPRMVGELAKCAAPVLSSQAEALGSLYVMEGSTLGGRVIHKHVERRLGLTDAAGCRYFAGYGAETGKMWRGFVERLDLAPLEDTESVVQGALATFASLQTLFR